MHLSCLKRTITLTYTWVSERKYKEKLKEWKFEKYLNSTEIKFIAAKEESRAKQQGKTTTFYNRGIKISSRRIETFKKRRKQPVDEMETLPAGKASDSVMSTSQPNVVLCSNPSRYYISNATSRR
jgi:hypothetical protein